MADLLCLPYIYHPLFCIFQLFLSCQDLYCIISSDTYSTLLLFICFIHTIKSIHFVFNFGCIFQSYKFYLVLFFKTARTLFIVSHPLQILSNMYLNYEGHFMVSSISISAVFVALFLLFLPAQCVGGLLLDSPPWSGPGL